VKAATEGRLLIIEGIEKAERNVLPLLNNLLENREMNLEDGRHLIAPDRYDKLLLVFDMKESVITFENGKYVLSNHSTTISVV
jgi:midasin (ATPase involved in ribosome maturation)